MSASTAGGDNEWRKNPYQNPLSHVPPHPERLSEEILMSLATRGCRIEEIMRLQEIRKEYQADIVADQHIAWHQDFGWNEMLQYRPGLLAAAVLKSQDEGGEEWSGSFQRDVSLALGWSLSKVLGFQMGVAFKLYYNPAGTTNSDYLDGIALGYLFYESSYNRSHA